MMKFTHLASYSGVRLVGQLLAVVAKRSARKILVAALLAISIATPTIHFASGAESKSAAPSAAAGASQTPQYTGDNTQLIALNGGASINFGQTSGFDTNVANVVKNACANYGASPSSSVCQVPGGQGVSAFQAASQTFGIPATYLACMTGHESHFKAQAGTDKAKSSGLTQFTEATAPTFVNKFQANKNGYKDAWKSYQKRCGTSRDQSAFTADALRSTDPKDADVQIFAMGMYLRDSIINAPKQSKLNEATSSTNLLNYLIVSYNAGEGAGAKFANSGFSDSGLSDTTKKYIADVTKCVSAANANGKATQAALAKRSTASAGSSAPKTCSATTPASPTAPTTTSPATASQPAAKAAAPAAQQSAPAPAAPATKVVQPAAVAPASSSIKTAAAAYTAKKTAADAAARQTALDQSQASATADAARKTAIANAKVASALAAEKKAIALRKRQQMIDAGLDPNAVSDPSSGNSQMSTGQ